jgi:hypothetical protein
VADRHADWNSLSLSAKLTATAGGDTERHGERLVGPTTFALVQVEVNNPTKQAPAANCVAIRKYMQGCGCSLPDSFASLPLQGQRRFRLSPYCDRFTSLVAAQPMSDQKEEAGASSSNGGGLEDDFQEFQSAAPAVYASSACVFM